jgi:hypothetical protein
MAGDGFWTAISPPNGRLTPSFVHDPAGDRFVLFAGGDGFPLNDCWTLDETAGWERLLPSGDAPPGRFSHATIHDEARNRMVVFGGQGEGDAKLGDVWALALGANPDWSEITPSSGPAPSARREHAGARDAARDRLLVFGGDDGSLRNDVWALSLGAEPAWTELHPAGAAPSPRRRHVVMFDPVRDRLLVFGGDDGSLRNDLWELSLAATPAWTELAPGGTPPSPRAFPVSAYDAAGDRWVVFGGWDGTVRLDEVWALSLAGGPSWTELSPR